ncbi:helix-turn-helix transcriptional regulator [Actinoplanes derwentensis]|uniref:AAA ATPase domain-containing protein n=1 Tax=Actinoplanes derwentensis TaxID=113562 RepID=A0A1H2DF42_9ACTN|nr:LuxR family transcriptional regulator [Actinoplanes derwentensis]GID84779.1 helix-turn-helix transcriptional regulator [Actinoplanes derwentensis]SDT81112.1 AAA ATPase domain-containing protein [Actinoplanes derwentensis]
MSDRIVGRTGELKVIRTALDETKEGRGGCHVIFGRPGIGKSRLLLAAGDHADDLDVAVAAREAFKHDRSAPLVTLAGALRACSPPAADFAWLAGLDDEPAGNYAKIHRLRDSLERFAAVQPLLIVIDDAHWMDELSALAVRELVPALASFPVRWLLASRPGQSDAPGWQALDWLSHRVTPIHLDVLDDDAVRRLCEDRIGARADDTVLALAQGCGGVPLRIEQLIGALLATRQIIIADGVATVVGDGLPSSFVTTVREIAGSLSPDARWLLRATSVLDGPIDIEAAARLMGGRDPGDLFGPIDEAVASGLLVEDHTGLVFRHALVHQALQSTLSIAQSQHLHGRAAVLAREQNRPAAEIAGHLLRSGRTGAGAAIGMLRGTAAGVAATAPATAADLMLQALRAIGKQDPQRPAVIAGTVGLLASAGRLVKANQLGQEALRADLDPATRARVRLGLAEAFQHAGQDIEAAGYADAGLAGPKVPAEVRARLYAIRAHAAVALDDLATADESGAEADRLGRDHEPGAAVAGLTARSLVAHAEGRLSGALTHAEAATALADRVRGQALHRHPRIWLANALTSLGRFEEAERALNQGHRECDALGTAWAQPLWHHYRSALLTARGRLDDAAAEADAGVAQAEQHSTYQLVVPLLGTLIRLAVLRGDLDQGRYLLYRIRELTAAGVTAPPEHVAWAGASLLAAEGDMLGAFRLMHGVYDTVGDRPALLVQEPAVAAVLVRLALTAGDPDRAAVAVAAASRLARTNPDSWAAAGAAEHAAGVLTRDPARLRAAMAAFRHSRRPLAVAAAGEDAAELARDTGDRETARHRYDEALLLAIAAGAHGVHRRLRDGLGGWLGPAGTGRPAEQQPVLPGLSQAERPVALLVAEGMTNIEVARRLNLSPHTVDSHLRKVFMKLEIHSRVELAARVARETRDRRIT